MSKFNIRCSCIICKQEITSQSLKQHLQKHVIKSYCIECNNPIFNKNKFCSSSCSAKYGNRNKDYSKFKSGPEKGTKPKNYYPYTKIKLCIICKKYHTGTGKTCSPKCKSILLSNHVRNRIDNGWNPNENRNRSLPSYLEKSFENWLLKNNYTNFIKNKTFKCSTKLYYGDFYFPELNLLIELDGSQHEQTKEYDLQRDALILEYYNIQTIRISHKEYIFKLKLDLIESILFT